MANPGSDARIHSIEQKIGRMESKSDTVGKQVSDMSVQLGRTENDLLWHRRVGWGIAGVYAVIFVGILTWVLSSYIPDKLNDRIPANLAERFGKREQDVTSVKEQLRNFTPASLQRLIPDTTTSNLSPITLSQNLTQAGRVIDVALTTGIPTDPKLLEPIRTRVRAVSLQSKDRKVKEAANSVLVRLDGYEIFSQDANEGRRPITVPKHDISREGGYFVAQGFIATCLGGPFVKFAAPDAAEKTFIFQVVVFNCTQVLDRATWSEVIFDQATVSYHGGPLRLADVTFKKNCKFDFGKDAVSQRTLSAILSNLGKPTTLLLPTS